MYGQQRDHSERLQRALLPRTNPTIPNLDIAAEYVAGTQGVDIGGDWFSIVALDGDRFGFVVGDVSGRGIDAVAVMARARFTIRAYLLDGHGPAATLEKCSHQFDINNDGHLTTAVVGIGSSRTGTVTLANAGHPAPLLVTSGGADFVSTVPGWPLGAGPTTYESTCLRMEPGSTLLCFTDGLVERRTEDIDTGMRRLAATANGAIRGPAEELVRHTVRELRTEDASDDIAVLAMRWAGER
jgi:serine phosphatase RsbU (regulator of sigma subunit)